MRRARRPGSCPGKQLEKKFKIAAREFVWQWLFPAAMLAKLAGREQRPEMQRFHFHDSHVTVKESLAEDLDDLQFFRERESCSAGGLLSGGSPCISVAIVTTVFDFLNEFRGMLHGAGIRFAITSGMACVRYGLQQTTKDSDWIIEPGHLGRLKELLETMECRTPPAVVGYRPIFGAPLDERWHLGGWTSHLLVRTKPNELDHHLDFFGRPPRVAQWQPDIEQSDYADRDTVARMKKTDRDRDWPIVHGLGSQAMVRGQSSGLLHLQSVGILRMAWRDANSAQREEAVPLRPLLSSLDSEPNDMRLEAMIRAERTIWESVNRERYRLYQREWKAFYRRWQTDTDWHWPTVEPFAEQHHRLVSAAERHELPTEPLALDETRQEIFRQGILRAAILANLDEGDILRLAPPITEILT